MNLYEIFFLDQFDMQNSEINSILAVIGVKDVK